MGAPSGSRRAALRFGERGQVEKVVWLHRTGGEQIETDHHFPVRDNGISGALHGTNRRLGYAEMAGQPFLRFTLPLAPFSQSHGSLHDEYFKSLYFSDGHKQYAGANYKQMTYPLRMNPRNRLRELRKQAGLSQTELAERTGVSQPAISQLENDVIAMDVAWMRAFARELNCTTADLLADEDNPDRLTPEERALIHSFREADAQQRTLLLRVAEPIQSYQAENDGDNGTLRKRA